MAQGLGCLKVMSRRGLEEGEAIEKAEKFISEVKNHGGFK